MTHTKEQIASISNADLKSLVGEDRFQEIRNARREALRSIEAAATFERHGYTTFSQARESGWDQLESIAKSI